MARATWSARRCVKCQVLHADRSIASNFQRDTIAFAGTEQLLIAAAVPRLVEQSNVTLLDRPMRRLVHAGQPHSDQSTFRSLCFQDGQIFIGPRIHLAAWVARVIADAKREAKSRFASTRRGQIDHGERLVFFCKAACKCTAASSNFPGQLSPARLPSIGAESPPRAIVFEKLDLSNRMFAQTCANPEIQTRAQALPSSRWRLPTFAPLISLSRQRSRERPLEKRMRLANKSNAPRRLRSKPPRR